MHSKFSSIIPSVKECLTFLTTQKLNILIRMHWKFCNSNFGGGGGGGGGGCTIQYIVYNI